MARSVAMITFLIRDYEEAIAYFTTALGFALIEDTPLPSGKRWVVVASETGARLLLARATTPDQVAAIGRQAGDRVFLFLETDDFANDQQRMIALGVPFLEAPRHEPYGIVAVFRDLYGNKWDLLQPAAGPHPQ